MEPVFLSVWRKIAPKQYKLIRKTKIIPTAATNQTFMLQNQTDVYLDDFIGVHYERNTSVAVIPSVYDLDLVLPQEQLVRTTRVRMYDTDFIEGKVIQFQFTENLLAAFAVKALMECK